MGLPFAADSFSQMSTRPEIFIILFCWGEVGRSGHYNGSGRKVQEIKRRDANDEKRRKRTRNLTLKGM